MSGPPPGERRPIARALEVLALLNRRPVSTLAQLHEDSGWAKSTLVRLLDSLGDCGFVVRDEVRSLYRLTARVRELSAGFGEDCLVTDVASGLLRQVTAEIQWPLAIGTLQGVEMVVRYSTMPFSPMALKPTTTANRHSLLTSAMGTTYLAHCPPEERAFLLAALQRAQRPDSELAGDEAAVDALLKTVAARGYGLRRSATRADGSSVAVPILSQGHLAGVLSMTVFTTLIDQVINEHLGVLRRTAEEISRRLGPS